MKQGVKSKERYGIVDKNSEGVQNVEDIKRLYRII